MAVFDWLYRQSPDVSLALDPTQPHTGNRSLRIVFDSRGFEDAGIQTTDSGTAENRI